MDTVRQALKEVFWNDGSYDQVLEAVCTKISYTGDHSAIPSGTQNYYYSKWRFYPLMYHHKDYTPGYGTANQFFRRSVDVPQDQSTIASALSAAVSGQTVEVTGSQSLSGVLTVPSGVTLKFKSGSSLTFNSYYIVTSNGTIIDQSGGTVICTYLKQSSVIKGLFQTIQSTINYASSGQTVEMQARTYNESASFSSRSNITLQGQGSGSRINSASLTTSSYINIFNLSVNSGITINGGYSNNVNNISSLGTYIINSYGSTSTDYGFSSAYNIGASFGYISYGGTGRYIQ